MTDREDGQRAAQTDEERRELPHCERHTHALSDCSGCYELLTKENERLYDEICEQIRKVAAACQRIEELEKGLNNLKCEAVGWIGLSRAALVQELSETNVRVMETRIVEAERLLEK